MFPVAGLCEPADGLNMSNVLTELLSPLSVSILLGTMSHDKTGFFSIHIYFHLGVKTRWKK